MASLAGCGATAGQGTPLDGPPRPEASAGRAAAPDTGASGDLSPSVDALTPATGPTGDPTSDPNADSTARTGAASARAGVAAAGRRGSGGATGDRTTVPWSQPLRERGKPDVAAVLRKAPAKGAVTLVTVKDVGGRPVISTTVAKDRTSAEDAVQDQLAAPDVLDVSVASKVAVLGSPDPYATQWALTTLGAAKTWSTQSATGVIVAVVDTGVAGSHPDLAGVVLPGKDYISAGGNGWADGHGHGTHVAGIIGAIADNGLGGAGLAQGVKILPVRALDSQGIGSDADVASGIVWAADSGAKVINLSIGAPDYSTAEAAAVAYATQRGAVVVAAAGNQRDQGNETSYPGAFPNVLAVAATDASDKTLPFSNTGPYVDLAAPGAAIVSAWPPTGYQSEWGTSMAAPFVSATAALVRAAAPSLTPTQVTGVLESTAKDIETSGRDDASGYGLVQPVAAVLAARKFVTPSPSPTPSVSGSPSPSGSPSVPAATFSLVSPPTRIAFRSSAAVTFALTSATGPVAGAQVAVCFKAAAASPTCTARTTDADGRASATQVLTASAVAYARFTGSATAASTTSANVAIAMLPSVQTSKASGAVTVAVTPVSTAATLTLQRLSGSTWTTVTSRAEPSTGRLTFGRLPSGTYRVAVSASPLHAAAVGGAVKVG